MWYSNKWKPSHHREYLGDIRLHHRRMGWGIYYLVSSCTWKDIGYHTLHRPIPTGTDPRWTWRHNRDWDRCLAAPTSTSLHTGTGFRRSKRRFRLHKEIGTCHPVVVSETIILVRCNPCHCVGVGVGGVSLGMWVCGGGNELIMNNLPVN